MKKNKKLFFTIEGLEWDELLKRHKFLAKAPTKEICDLFGEEFDKNKKDKRVAKDDVLIKKYEFFLHNLIKRQISSDNGIAYLNSKVLEKVFGKDYLLIKKTLVSMGVIGSTGFYDIYTTSYGYFLSYDYQNRIKTERKSIFYPSQKMVEKLNKELKKNEKKVSKSAQENLTDDFYDSYVNSLNKLKLVYSKQAQKFIDVHFSQNNYSKHYYEYILEEYNNSNFYIKVPNLQDNRIYHILTSTPRNLKYFLNIKYTVDIHNSHPLLFSKFLMDKYNIPLSYRKSLLSSLLEINPYINVYNVRKKLYNLLKQNNIKYSEILEIPIDVLKYLYLVCSGKFWNVVIPTLEEKTTNTYNIIRQDVKVIMFAQVFYGKSLTSRGKKYAKIFAQQFPNVYTVVLSFKRRLARGKRTVLTHKLMALESQLFRETLKRLFEKGYKVISIHDAIVVLNVIENDNLTPEIVKEVLCDVYAEIGLLPDCSTDYYGEEEMQEFLKKEEFLREKGDEYIKDLRKLAEEGDDDIKQLVEDYDNGRSEIILTPDGKDVMLHLKDVKSIMYK